MQARLRHWPHPALLVTTRIDRQINNNEPDNKPGAGNNIGTEAKMVHVPYRGAAPAITGMLSNRVQVIFDSMPSIIGHIAPGGLRALAVTTATRSPQLPDVPTVAKTVPGYEASALFGMGAPKKTPPEIVEKLNREVNAVLADPRSGSAGVRRNDLGRDRKMGKSGQILRSKVE